MFIFHRIVLFVVVLAVVLCGVATPSMANGRLNPAVIRLPKLNIDPATITVSGVSSGAFMAVQMHVAYSKMFSGAASVAGGIYYCAEGDASRATSDCMASPRRLESRRYLDHAMQEARKGRVDDLKNLRNDRVYLFAGTEDRVLNPVATTKLREFYSALMPAERIETRMDVRSAHGFPTIDFGSMCRFGGKPWLLKCDLDISAEILRSLYGRIKPAIAAPEENLRSYDQEEFGAAEALMFGYGYVYVPTHCAKGGRCRLHIALHGCAMNPDAIGSDFAIHSGYNSWAEANNLVILYPQVAKAPANPYGCWDWWGYGSPDYAAKSGPQMVAIKKMVDRLVVGSSGLRRIR